MSKTIIAKTEFGFIVCTETRDEDTCATDVINHWDASLGDAELLSENVLTDEREEEVNTLLTSLNTLSQS